MTTRERRSLRGARALEVLDRGQQRGDDARDGGGRHDDRRRPRSCAGDGRASSTTTSPAAAASSPPRENESTRPAPSTGAAAAAARAHARPCARVAGEPGAEGEPDRGDGADRVPVAERRRQPAAGRRGALERQRSHGRKPLRQPDEHDRERAGRERGHHQAGHRAQQRDAGDERAEVQRDPLRVGVRDGVQRRPGERGDA